MIHHRRDTNGTTNQVTIAYEKDGVVYNGIPLFENVTKKPVADTVSVSVNKVWKDNSNEKGMRPKRIAVQLYKNKTAYGDKPHPIEIHRIRAMNFYPGKVYSYLFLGRSQKGKKILLLG